MSKIFITGSGGVGKTTVIKQLRERGYTAYDTDDIPGANRLEDKRTGEELPWPEGYIDWKNIYTWNWQRPKITELLASDETVFIGAVVGNWRDFLNEFDTFIVLSTPEHLHLHHLQTRNAHTHGQGEQNVTEMVARQQQAMDKFIAAGAIRVINDRSIDEVVDEILRVSHVG